jgi:hypothetical protein
MCWCCSGTSALRFSNSTSLSLSICCLTRTRLLFCRRYYVPLLSHYKQYIRNFAAETFAFLLRQLKPKLLAQTLPVLLQLRPSADASAKTQEPVQELDSTEELRDGVSRVWVDLIKVCRVVSFDKNSLFGSFILLLSFACRTCLTVGTRTRPPFSLCSSNA